MNHELTTEERDLLASLVSQHGRSTKPLIRQAWMTGDWSELDLPADADASILQRLRNTRGPSWLVRVKLGKVVA